MRRMGRTKRRRLNEGQKGRMEERVDEEDEGEEEE